MQLFLILCLTVAVSANHTVPYDVYVSRGGLPLPDILRTNKSWYKPERGSIRNYVYFGDDADDGQFPWIVSLFMTDRFICGGSIINNRTILTAAHCVSGAIPSEVSIGIGSIRRTEGSLVNVSEIKIHSSYDNVTLDYDIAILITGNHIPIDDQNVNSVSLAEQEPNPGTEVLIAGWGSTQKEWNPNNLQYAPVNIVERKICQTKYGYQHFQHMVITDRMICAGDPLSRSSSCKGDSGGPLTQNGVLVGVVSWGIPCSTDSYPNVYTNVAKLFSWINSNKF